MRYSASRSLPSEIAFRLVYAGKRTPPSRFSSCSLSRIDPARPMERVFNRTRIVGASTHRMHIVGDPVNKSSRPASQRSPWEYVCNLRSESVCSNNGWPLPIYRDGLGRKLDSELADLPFQLFAIGNAPDPTLIRVGNIQSAVRSYRHAYRTIGRILGVFA
jgi:hypothetical protein